MAMYMHGAQFKFLSPTSFKILRIASAYFKGPPITPMQILLLCIQNSHLKALYTGDLFHGEEITCNEMIDVYESGSLDD